MSNKLEFNLTEDGRYRVELLPSHKGSSKPLLITEELCAEKKCECGSASVGDYFHSDYCPLYKKE